MIPGVIHVLLWLFYILISNGPTIDYDANFFKGHLPSHIKGLEKQTKTSSVEIKSTIINLSKLNVLTNG